MIPPETTNKVGELAKVLHEKLCKELVARIDSGEATTQDLNVMRQFLKDNNISAVPVIDEEDSPSSKRAKNGTLASLIQKLPFPKTLQIQN